MTFGASQKEPNTSELAGNISVHMYLRSVATVVNLNANGTCTVMHNGCTAFQKFLYSVDKGKENRRGLEGLLK